MRRKITLTPEQEQLIKNNWQKSTHEKMSKEVGVGVNWMSWYCNQKGYKKLKRVPGPKTPVKKNINQGPEKKIKHPPADHTNISREQHVERWLNVAI
jgi:hypothetical protein